jgi:dihydrolipoamide dehydrogenase
MTLRVAVIGAGPGGYVAALRCARLGARVTVVENHKVGGTCLHQGCIPSKIIRQAADRRDVLGQAHAWGIGVPTDALVDLDVLNRRKAKVIDSQAQAIAGLLKDSGVDLVQGMARIRGPGVLDIQTVGGGAILEWDRLILATGSAPAGLAALPFDGRQIISSNEAVNLDRVPQSVAIVGGGVIGCEFAGMLASLGARVTLIEALDRLLPLDAVDQQASVVLQREMKKRKINVQLNTLVLSARPEPQKVSLTLGPPTGRTGAATAVLEAQTVLVCVGRQATTAGLGLAAVGVKTDAKGWVLADGDMATSAPGVFAIGDVLGPSKAMLAHVASAEARVAAENAMGCGPRIMDYGAIPLAVFTDPEVACVGQTQARAENAGANVRTDTVLFRSLGKAQAMGKIAGQATLVSETAGGRILGVHLIGAHATDLIAEAVVAVRLGLTVTDLAETIHAHPTLAEIMGEVALKALEKK